jgi:predicted phage tail protein
VSDSIDDVVSVLLNAGEPVVPDAPTIGTVTPGNGEVTLSWTAPASDGGAAIIGYVVTPRIAGTPQAPVTFTSPATTQTITGLTNGTTYTFTVAATNLVGTGPDSTASGPVTPAATAPGPPTIIRNATAANQKATVSWLAPASDGGSPITGYVVTPYVGYYPLPSTSFSSTATTQTVTGLTNGTTYRFRVQAVNVAGTSGYSTVTNPVTPAPTVPGAPTIVLNATAGNAEATISWITPNDDGGSPITGYVVTPYVGYIEHPSTTFDASSTTRTVTGLINGKTYRFRVRAINAIGTGGYSKVTNPVTPSA